VGSSSNHCLPSRWLLFSWVLCGVGACFACADGRDARGDVPEGVLPDHGLLLLQPLGAPELPPFSGTPSPRPRPHPGRPRPSRRPSAAMGTPAKATPQKPAAGIGAPATAQLRPQDPVLRGTTRSIRCIVVLLHLWWGCQAHREPQWWCAGGASTASPGAKGGGESRGCTRGRGAGDSGGQGAMSHGASAGPGQGWCRWCRRGCG